MYLVFVFGVDAFFYVGITEDVKLKTSCRLLKLFIFLT